MSQSVLRQIFLLIDHSSSAITPPKSDLFSGHDHSNAGSRSNLGRVARLGRRVGLLGDLDNVRIRHEIKPINYKSQR